MPFEAKHIYPKEEANTLSLNDPKSQQKLRPICLKNKIIILTKLLYHRGIKIQTISAESTTEYNSSQYKNTINISVQYVKF